MVELEFIFVMWWGGQADSEAAYRIRTIANDRATKSFFAPTLVINELDELLESAEVAVDRIEETRPHIFKTTDVNVGNAVFALPMPEPAANMCAESPETAATHKTNVPSYWSIDRKFWDSWKSEEEETRKKTLADARIKLEESRKEAAAEEERARLKAEEESKVKIEAVKADVSPSKVEKICREPVLSTPEPKSIHKSFSAIMEEGKQYRSSCMDIWKEMSLGVSTTAANSRSVQQNANNVLSSLSKASGPTAVITWLSAVCGSKIVQQATGGNKSLVWSFAYLTRIVSTKFPDVLSVGVVGELMTTAEYTLNGNWTLPLKGGTPKDFESFARFWVAILCVFNDEKALWSWVAVTVNKLQNSPAVLPSLEAQWNLMKVYIWMDVGLFDFRRIFGHQALLVTDILENKVFPKIDAELQSNPQPTSVSVQIRFYLDACYNILQSRKYSEPPEGQVLAASRESELNPDL